LFAVIKCHGVENQVEEGGGKGKEWDLRGKGGEE
jgi:hypothetical protein